ncbi:hypothetical protein C8J56DRAFT_976262, partial [Mycena floridula]
VQAVASTSFIHTSAVVGAQLSTKAKKQRKQERYTAALALKPSVVLGHRAGEESKWLECDLAKVLVDEQQLRVPQPPLPVDFPNIFAYGISREETHALFGILPDKSTERHLTGVTDSKELNAMEQNATKEGLEKANVFAKVVDLRNADAGGIAYENRRRIIVAFSTPKNPFDSGRTEVQAALLTYRIRNMWQHLQTFPHDVGNLTGLRKLVHHRAKVLKYLKRTQRARYDLLLPRLGLEQASVEGELIV